jgi:hypothetical protein
MHQAAGKKRSLATTGEDLTSGDVPSQIRDALTTAKNLTTSVDAREQINRLRAGRAQRSPVLQANVRAEGLLASVLEKAGFDAEKFKAIQAESRAELRRILQAQQAEAVKHSADVRATFRAAIESRRKAIEHVVASGISPFFQQVVFDRPFLIWPSTQSPDLSLDSYQIEPWNSWAKFKVDSTSEVDLAGIEFYFFWENRSKDAVLINVDTWLMLNGYGRIDFPEHWNWEFSDITIIALLSLLEGWNQPPTTPAIQADQHQKVLEIADDFEGGPLFTFMPSVPGATWWGHGWGEGVSQTCNLRYNQELVPPGAGVVIKVGAEISWINHGGAGIEADFNSGDYQVMCPFLQIQIMNPGPLTIKSS